MYRTTKQEERLKGYLAAAEAPDLTPEEVRAIDEAGAKEHHRHFVCFFIFFALPQALAWFSWVSPLPL